MVALMSVTPVICKSMDSGLRDKIMEMLLGIPDDVFYNNGLLSSDGCKAFNRKLMSELQNKFGNSLRGALTNDLQDFYSYPVEELVTLFCIDEEIWQGCIFIPDSDFGQLPKDDITPCDLVMQDTHRLIKPFLELADFTDFYVVGYFYPLSLTRYGIDVSYV